MFIDNLVYPQALGLEFDHNHLGMTTVPGYLFDCTDGHRYMVFAPDMDSLKHMHAYHRILGMVKTRMSDHDYDPVRQCIEPAWSYEKDEFGDHKVFHAPASEMGKIYVVK